MRFVDKNAPPENISAEGQLEMTFVECEQDYLAKLPSIRKELQSKWARDCFGDMNKKIIRQHLRVEQRHLCVYCEDRVEEPEFAPFPPVEHWRPLAKSLTTAIHWRNIYQSCARPRCCDDRKHDSTLTTQTGDDLPWPCEFPYEEVIGFSHNGEMYVRRNSKLTAEQCEALERAIGRAEDDLLQGDRFAILNLNHPTLREARAAAIDTEFNRSRAHSMEERGSRATRYLEAAKRPAFVSVRVAWLRKQCGVDR